MCPWGKSERRRGGGPLCLLVWALPAAPLVSECCTPCAGERNIAQQLVIDRQDCCCGDEHPIVWEYCILPELRKFLEKNDCIYLFQDKWKWSWFTNPRIFYWDDCRCKNLFVTFNLLSSVSTIEEKNIGFKTESPPAASNQPQFSRDSRRSSRMYPFPNRYNNAVLI